VHPRERLARGESCRWTSARSRGPLLSARALAQYQVHSDLSRQAQIGKSTLYLVAALARQLKEPFRRANCDVAALIHQAVLGTVDSLPHLLI